MKRKLIITLLLLGIVIAGFMFKIGLTGLISYTPIENVTTTNTYAEISVNFSNVSSMEQFIFNWDTINYTIYDNSLVLMMNFDNRSALEENDSHVFDVSGKGNNATVLGATFTTSGKYNGGFSFDGVDDYINAGNDSSLNITGNITLSVWINAGSSTTTLGNVSSYTKINTTSLGGGLDADDRFGRSVANIGDLNGDGISDIASGVYNDDDGASNAGAVWIMFMNTNGSVKSYAKINTTSLGGGLDAGDNFGISLSNLGDLDGDGIIDLAVGAHSDDDGKTDAGAVYILFMNTNGSVKSYAKINDTSLGSELNDSDSFGKAISNIGDLDNDGIEEIAIGSPNDDDGGDARGSIWILFMHSNGSVKSYTKINDTTFGGDLDDNDKFGTSLTNIGDLNRDGVNDIASGMESDDDGKTDAGAVWIMFMNTNGSVKSYAKINDSSLGGELEAGDNLGRGVANIGDLNGDGVIDLAANANGDDDGASNAGAVWILFMNTNGSVKSYVKINDTNVGGELDSKDRFGISLSSISDLNGDGVLDIAAGAHADDDGGSAAGAVWILFMEDGFSSIINKQDSYQIRTNHTHAKVVINGSSLISSIDSGWNHIALTSNITHGFLYVNGVLLSTITSGVLASSVYDVSIGKYFNGVIDEPRIWNTSLSSSEISQLYKSNLYKINKTAWSFYTNQAGLLSRAYNYSFFIKDSYGLIQSSIGEVIINYLKNDVFMTAVTESSILISTIFKINVDIYVEYGTSSGNYTQNSTIYLNQTINESIEITLNNLDESTRYYFRVRMRKNSTGGDYIAFEEYNFTTRKRKGESFSFVHMTDTHLGKDILPYFYDQDYVNIINNITDLIAGSGSDFVIDTGDTGQTHVAAGEGLYSAHNQSEADERYSLVRNYFENMSLPVYTSLGNHDGEMGWGAEGTNGHSEELYNYSLNARLKYWPAPTNQTYSYGGGPYENYYAFDWGDATFIVLDSYRYNTIAPLTGDDWVLGDEQLDWLETTLSSSDKKWKFIFSHHIIGGADYETISHGYNYGDGGGNYSWTGDQENINHLMEQYNAQIFFYGHVHRFYHDWANWSDFGRTDYVNYVTIMGGSWKGTFECPSVNRILIYPNAICDRGYTKVDVSPDNVTFYFINWSNGANLYNYTIYNTAPSVSLVSPRGGITHGDFVFNYEDPEYDNGKNCTLFIDEVQAVTERGTMSGVETIFTFTGLSEGTHNWFVNCSDGVFSSVSETKEFTYLIDRGGIQQIYYPSSSQLNEGYSRLLKEGQKVQLTINNKIYTVVINLLDSETKELEIELEEIKKTIKLKENETEKIDLDNDGYYDLQISVTEVRINGYSNLEFKEIHEEVPAEKQEEQEKPSKIEGAKIWYWFIAGVIILIVIGIVVYLVNKKKKNK